MSYKLYLGKYTAKATKPPFDRDPNIPTFAGISGGRTSAMMAALLDDGITLSFQNTGREHDGTYVFLDRLQNLLGREIIWLEFRKPEIRGSAPKFARFEIVNYETADRKGRPFIEFMETIEEYRATKGLGPVAPYHRMRLCTAYMKSRVMRSWIASMGIDRFVTHVGLRSDEPDRVEKLHSESTSKRLFRTPLSSSGITKNDVMRFWDHQPFDLEIQDYEGNCTGCFLKDQADRSRAMMDPASDPGWWFSLQDRWPDFGGRDNPSYRQLAAEGPTRLRIEKAIAAGDRDAVSVDRPQYMSPRRFRLVVIQERKRLDGFRQAFSCMCENAYGDQILDSDEDEP